MKDPKVHWHPLTYLMAFLLGVILFCYTFAKGTAERRAIDRGVPGN